MPIDVIVAEPHGFCGDDQFGVQRAVKIAQETGKQYSGGTYLLGEIVHNQHVVDGLERDYGVRTVQSLEDIPGSATVIIRAHGMAPEIYEQAKGKDLKIIDATCPLVAQSHRSVKRLVAKGKKILYIASDRKGNKYHDEAEGVRGEAPAAITLTTLEELGEVEVKEPENTVVLTQTTLSVLETKKKLEELKKKYPTITIEPHICPATTERQAAVIKIAQNVGFVVIVGSPTSSNSKRLREVAEAVGAQAYIVDTADELKPEWFESVKRVGVSSGASTPEDLLKAVVERIKTFKP